MKRWSIIEWLLAGTTVLVVALVVFGLLWTQPDEDDNAVLVPIVTTVAPTTGSTGTTMPLDLDEAQRRLDRLAITTTAALDPSTTTTSAPGLQDALPPMLVVPPVPRPTRPTQLAPGRLVPIPGPSPADTSPQVTEPHNTIVVSAPEPEAQTESTLGVVTEETSAPTTTTTTAATTTTTVPPTTSTTVL